MRRSRTAAAALTLLAASAISPRAQAFLIVGDSAKVTHDATRLTVLREGARAVVTVQARASGSARYGLLVPVHDSLPAASRALAVQPLARLDLAAAPRFAELWEQNPCEIQLERPDLDPAPTEAGPAPALPAESAGPGWEVKPAEGKTAGEVAQWLTGLGFSVPDEATAALEAALGGGGKLALATITTAPGGDAKAAAPAAWLPPFRYHFDAKDFTLPTRMLSVSGRGAPHDLVVQVVANQRYEAASGTNQAIPTNLDVTEAAREKLGALQTGLLDYTLWKKPEALVTEYAWRASTCEGCTVKITDADVGALGGELLPSAAAGQQQELIIDASSVSRLPDGPADLRQRLADCYAKALPKSPGAGGEVTVDVKTGAGGEVTSADGKGKNEVLVACAVDGVKAGKLDKPSASGTVKVTFVPVGRHYFGSLVLSRLHARLGKGVERDLSLRPGSPLEGGREEGPKGKAEARVHASETGDNFQARYVVRHRWPGALECGSPRRGVWGPKPKDLPPPAASGAPSASGSASAGQAGPASAGPAGSAKAPPAKTAAARPGVAGPAAGKDEWSVLAVMLEEGKLPDLADFVIDLPPAKQKAVDVAPKPLSPEPAAPAPSASGPAAAADGGGGCALPGGTPRGGAWLGGALALLGWVGRRRLGAPRRRRP
ncbi:MAG: DUF2330 domain-containing protein [Polyangiaceae bacterium]